MLNNISTVHWGILGTARIAEKVAAAIHKANAAELTAVASRSGQRAAAWASEYGVTRSYGSYAELLNDSQLDAIYIPLPPSMHAEWTIKAAEKGKHVLCEKPLAMNAGEAREMAAACRENNVQLMDGVMWVHHPRAVEMLKPIQDGTLGTLRRVTSALTFNWDEIPVGDLRLQRELGGGSMLDLGWYCVRVTLWAFGELPKRVFGNARYDNDVDRNFSAILFYDDERMATFDSGFDVGMRKWVEVAGTKSSLICDDFTKPWDESRPRFWIHDVSGKNAEHVTAAPIQEVRMIEEMCGIIRTGSLENRWPQEAINTQRVCDALDQSARKGEWVGVK
ncbi:MAG: Gfo/Idh/MocA family oxidoreductase [Planctomycetes bacterium]|nr:Gfo/Idh/MocA family oxidoreductase [Planctomycetota bacterium]